MTITINNRNYIAYLERFSKRLAEEKDYITELDSITGDGDHWVNMNMGFQKLIASKDELETLALGKMFKKIGMLVMSTVGGSSGVLYGSAYIKGAQTIGDKEEISVVELLEVLQAKLTGIMERGNAKPGDKTMIDALHGGVESMKQAIESGKNDKEILQALKEGAEKGMEETKSMEAAKGRAYYQANKGVGHLDPGAVTMYYQLATLADTLLEA